MYIHFPARKLAILDYYCRRYYRGRNAVYIWRGEKGIDPGTGQVVRTWEDVFDKYRADARDLGAQRMHHTAAIGERILEYLTRDPKELDK